MLQLHPVSRCPILKLSLAVSLALALLVSVVTRQVSAEPVRVDSIIWLSGDRLPSDKSGKADSTQIAPSLVAFMQAQWPEVQHSIVHANALRAWQLIASGEHVCQPSSVRTPEREKLAYFTNTLLGPPQQLIVRRDKLAALPRNAAGEVDLARLLADERLRGALVDGRSYGSYIDTLLAQRPANKAIAPYAVSDFGSKIMAMLGMDRADYAIGYDAALSQDRESNPLLNQLVTQAIAGASEPVLVGVACPRTAWGLAAIQGIDQVLGTLAGAAMLRQVAERWLTPETRQLYGARLDAFYKERAKPSVIR